MGPGWDRIWWQNTFGDTGTSTSVRFKSQAEQSSSTLPSTSLSGEPVSRVLQYVYIAIGSALAANAGAQWRFSRAAVAGGSSSRVRELPTLPQSFVGRTSGSMSSCRGTPTLSRLSRSNIAFTCHSARTFTPFKLHSLAKKCVRDPAPPYAQLPGPHTQDGKANDTIRHALLP